jgi:hypothetical protein
MKFAPYAACSANKRPPGTPFASERCGRLPVAEESSNPQRIPKKMGDLGSGEDGISLISLGRDGEWEDYMTKNVLDDASGKNQAAADRYYHQLHLKPWAKSPPSSGLPESVRRSRAL